MTNPTAAILVIGDEILSGRTREANAHHLAETLTGRGITLREIRVVPDEAGAITSAVRALAAAHDHLFTSGGIGPTHDDITADCVAAAFGAPIDVRADARARLEAHYARQGGALNAARLRMARIPEGATLIDNPVSAAPGFTLQNVHVLAGVPEIFRAMVASLVPRITGGAPLESRTLCVEAGEGDVAGPLSDFAGRWPDLSVGSYPARQNGTAVVNVVLRGPDAARLDAGIEDLRVALG